MSLNGMSLSDFKTQAEAMKVADQLVADNKKDLGHNLPDIPHENPLLVRVFYVFGQGKKRSSSQTEGKEFSGTTDAKTQKQLQDAQCFIEGMGLGSASSSSGGSKVKIENVMFGKMTTQKESLRTALNINL